LLKNLLETHAAVVSEQFSPGFYESYAILMQAMMNKHYRKNFVWISAICRILFY